MVSDSAWRVFLAAEITPRLPDGLTVLDAAGQWCDGSGAIVRERTKLVIILARQGKAGMQKTVEIVEAYKRTFGQKAVLLTVAAACVSFWAGAGCVVIIFEKAYPSASGNAI